MKENENKGLEVLLEVEDTILPTKYSYDSKGRVKIIDDICFEILSDDRERQICGRNNIDGGYCRNAPGQFTAHPGIGPCFYHASNKEETVILSQLGGILGSGKTLGDFFNKIISLSEIDIKNVDNEIKILYFLLLQLFNEISEDGKISLEKEDRLKSLVTQLRNTKIARGKLENLTKVDAAYVAYILDKLAITLKRLIPDRADLVLSSFLDIIRSPYDDVNHFSKILKKSNDEIVVGDL